MHVQPLVPWRSTLPLGIPSITAACSVMLAGPALSAFAIFHSSECADVVNVPGGNGAVAEETSSRSSLDPVVTEKSAANPIAAQRALLIMRTSLESPFSYGAGENLAPVPEASFWRVLHLTVAERPVFPGVVDE